MSDRGSDSAATPAHGPGILAFGDFLFDEANGILSREGSEILLSPRPLAVLRCLLERQGDVVSKQELLDEAWPDVAVEDAVLSEAIKVLRGTLGDKSDQPRYIQTLHRRGYRFIADVSSATVARPGFEDAATMEALSAASPRRSELLAGLECVDVPLGSPLPIGPRCHLFEGDFGLGFGTFDARFHLTEDPRP